MTPYVSYVIVLQGTEEHVRYTTSRTMSKQLHKSAKRYNWPLKIWPAVDGSKLADNFWDLNTVKVSTETAGKFLEKKGAWGCLLSHVSLWQHCVNLNTPIIVLEHDAVITAPWPDLDISKAVIKLHSETKTKHKSTVGRWSTGAWAYTLTPLQAQALLTGYASVGAMAADKLIGTNLVPWRFLDWDLVEHNSEPHISTVSQRS